MYEGSHLAISGDEARKLGILCYDPILGRRRTTRRMIVVYEWSRDCDCCEASSVMAIPAGRRYFRKSERAAFEGAEGPTQFYIIPADQLEDYKPSFRDRVLEAWENGETYNV